MLKEIAEFSLSIKGSSYSGIAEVKSPYDGQVIGMVGQADAAMIKLAIASAQDCFKNTMQQMPAYKRSEILAKTSALITEQIEDLAQTIALEGGKPIKTARVEVARAANTFAIAARETLNIDGEKIPMDSAPAGENRFAVAVREPIGIIAAITPFNFPLNMVAHKVAPALAAGNVVILKPSPQTPIASFKLKALLENAGLPKDSFQIVPCLVSEASALVRDPRLAMLTFTGSPEVGWNFRKEVQPGVRLVLELGGNGGVIVHQDADLETASAAICRGGYSHAGQTCIAIQRVYVQEQVYDNFLKLFLEKVKSLKTGDPLNEQTDVGPLIDERSAKKTISWLDEAVKNGAKLLCGGKVLANNLVEPTVLVDTKPDMSVVCKEVFGPIVSVMKYDSIDEAIHAMNDTRYGLQANVFTNNLDIAFKAAAQLEAGTVNVNDVSFRLDHMPAGGHKESGLGLEGVRYAIHEMMQTKFICLNLSSHKKSK